MRWDRLWRGATLATCGALEPGYGLIEDGAIAIYQGKIVWIGKAQDLPNIPATCEIHDVTGHLISPGFIDCHTHLVYGGDRAYDFSRRLHGATYAEIAQQGGGIASTVKATTEASFEQLYDLSLQRAKAMIRQGVTTLEIKSGYGLLFDAEIKQLKVIEKLKATLPIHIEATFLALHALPKEYAANADAYVDYVCTKTLPFVAEHTLATSVDVFCESIAFSPKQVEKVFQRAIHLGLRVKIHAEQLSNQQGALLAAGYQALSADHVEYIDEVGVQAMKKANMVAVLLPGAFYFLRETTLPPIALFRQYNIPMALATDANPGTSPTHNLPLMMNMAATLWRLTPEECLRGITVHAAAALGLSEKCGSLAIGLDANFIIWPLQSPDQLVYYIDQDCSRRIVYQGTILEH